MFPFYFLFFTWPCNYKDFLLIKKKHYLWKIIKQFVYYIFIILFYLYFYNLYFYNTLQNNGKRKRIYECVSVLGLVLCSSLMGQRENWPTSVFSFSSLFTIKVLLLCAVSNKMFERYIFCEIENVIYYRGWILIDHWWLRFMHLN